MLMHKFGREFSLAVMENKDGCVSERVCVHILRFPAPDKRLLPHTQVVKKLVIETPTPSLVDAYLEEIAKGYGIEWMDPKRKTDDGQDGDESSGLKVRFPPRYELYHVF
jgi:vacuolar protein sorting-associated protein IST1